MYPKKGNSNTRSQVIREEPKRMSEIMQMDVLKGAKGLADPE